MSTHGTFESLFLEINKDIDQSMAMISEEIADMWRQLVWDRFYMAYEPRVYARTYENLASLSVLDINKVGGVVSVRVGYDDSKIKFYDQSSIGLWDKHEKPSEMGSLFEYGSIIGHDSDGIRAIDTMLEYVRSSKFAEQFKAKLKAKGYEFLK